jgi:hypothetical protein
MKKLLFTGLVAWALAACGSGLERPGGPADTRTDADDDTTGEVTPDSTDPIDADTLDQVDEVDTADDAREPDVEDITEDADVDSTGGDADSNGGDADAADTDATSPCQGLADDTPCDDGNLCTLGDRCSGGRCMPTSALACNDNNVCTDDTCRPDVGCVWLNNLATCEDADPCSSNDRCSAGVCRPGGFACDDNNPCTRDTCALDGACTHLPDDELTCEDGSACTSGDYCADGFCIGGLADGCLSDSPCVATRCAEDGLTCRSDVLDGLGCDDGNVCTLGDQCLGGICRSGIQRSCGWDTECGVFRCDRIDGCLLETAYQLGKTCSDDNRCTTGDTCDGAGTCVPHGPAECDDDNPCTEDSCSASWGCEYTSVSGPCDDTNLCTTADACQFGQCRGTPLPCDDQNACTTDSCDPLTGCQFLPLRCDDQNVCTTDACDPDRGCVFTPLAAACDDGLSCTAGDTCIAGTCVGSVTCDDEDACTTDLCDGAEGCLHIERDDCAVGLVRITAVGLDAPSSPSPGFGQWVAIVNDGEVGFALDGWVIAGAACDCEASLSAITIAPGATVHGLRKSLPAPLLNELAPGGPTDLSGYTFTFGEVGDAVLFEEGDVLQLIDATGAVVSTFTVD